MASLSICSKSECCSSISEYPKIFNLKYLIQSDKITESFVNRADLDTLTIKLELVKCHVIIVYQGLAYVSLDYLDLVVKVYFINWTQMQYLVVKIQKI
jgi:hypothetical protein